MTSESVNDANANASVCMVLSVVTSIDSSSLQYNILYAEANDCNLPSLDESVHSNFNVLYVSARISERDRERLIQLSNAC